MSKNSKTTVCLINARSGSAHEHIKSFEKLCKDESIELKKFVALKDPAHLEDELLSLLKLKPSIVMIGGGDGTIITAIDFLMKQGYKQQFAILPLGTANYLARNLGIPLDIVEAVKLIKTPHATNLRLPVINKSVFSLTANIGITTEVSDNVSVRLKKQLGQTAYFLELVRQLFSHDSFQYDLLLDDTKRLQGESHQIVVSNADLSVQLALTPDNNLHNPTVTVTVYDSGNNKLKLIGVLLVYIFSFGRLKKGMKVHSAQSLSIKTKPKKSISIDGEILHKTPIDIKFTDEIIRILTPMPSTAQS